MPIASPNLQAMEAPNLGYQLDWVLSCAPTITSVASWIGLGVGVLGLFVMGVLLGYAYSQNKQKQPKASPVQTPSKNLNVNTSILDSMEPSISFPKLAKEPVDFMLWRSLLAYIPESTWIRELHQDEANVQWLCLGPDNRYFTATAHLNNAQWAWNFTEPSPSELNPT